jgi:hypothetical protein
VTVRLSSLVGQLVSPRLRHALLLLSAVLFLTPAATKAQITTEIPTTLVGWNAFVDAVQWPEVDVSTDGVIVFIWEESGSSAPRAAVTHAYSVDGVELVLR